MNFKEQISDWWNRNLKQLNALKEAHKDGVIVKIAGEGEINLNDEQSAELLARLVQLVDALLESNKS